MSTDDLLNEFDALSLAILAVNTILHPEGTSDDDFDSLDLLGEKVIETLVALREASPHRPPDDRSAR